MNFKKLLSLMICLLSVGSALHALSYQKPCSIEDQEPHNIYFGPDFSVLQLDISIHKLNVKGTKFMWGLACGYDYLKPQSFYFGASVYVALTPHDFSAQLYEYPDYQILWSQPVKALSNIEARGGYSFTSGRWMLTPFLGLGSYDLFNIDKMPANSGFSENLPYVTVGNYAKYTLANAFSLGINVNIFRTFLAEQKFIHAPIIIADYNNVWGGKIGIPFTWHIGRCKKWDVQVEPYFSSLDFTQMQNIYGTRFVANYRF